MTFLEKIDAVTSALRDVMTSRRMGNALTPFMPILVMGGVALWFGYKTSNQALAIIFAIAGIFCIAAYIAAYFYLAVRRPDLLRTETYHLRQRGMDLIASKGNRFPVKAQDVELMSDPYPEQRPKLLARAERK